MSKGLEALHKLLFDKSLDKILTVEEEANLIYTIKTELKRLEELQKEWEMEHTLRIRLENIVYEKSEALRIIKEKRVNVNLIRRSHKKVWNYNKNLCAEDRQLTQAEFDLLKEWLK